MWDAALTGQGYGLFYDGERSVGAYKWAYVQARGPVPDGLELDHLCEQRDCVNPDHLEPKTHKENSQRAANHLRGRTHCSLGHPLEGANLSVKLVRGSPVRRCKMCLNLAADVKKKERQDAAGQ